MNNLVLAFSGGCFCGKTTTIEKLKDIFGDDCIVLDEIIRKKNISSISDIRKNPKEYLKFQEIIINQKIEEEIKAKNIKNKIILIDRALSDSLFYLTFYVDKINLDEEDFIFYKNLIKKVKLSANNSFNNIYDFVLEFSPIEKDCNDKIFRPLNINSLKYIEHDLISMYNKSFTDNIIKIDYNKYDFNYIINNSENCFNKLNEKIKSILNNKL